MKVDELKEFIHQKLIEESIYTLGDVEDIIDKDIQKVAKRLYPDNHRWYQMATDVYKCEDGFLGVRGVSIIFSESMCGSDCGQDVELFEMEQVPSVTYKIK